MLSLRSASSDPESCVIDCGDSGRGFYFASGETSECVVRGVTITNGAANQGGALYCLGSDPVFVDCDFSENASVGFYDEGGGVYCRESDLTLINCRIMNNTGESSAGLYCESGIPVLYGCTISGNALVGEWTNHGCVYLSRTNAFLIQCTVFGNTGSHGAGVDCSRGSPTLVDCTVSGNVAVGEYASGGGLYCGNSDLTMTGCTVTGNSTDANGGGLYVHLGFPTISDCTFAGNSAEEYGGGVWCDGDLTVAACTIAGNTAEEGGGIYCAEGGSPTISDCLIVGNGASESGGAIRCDLGSVTLTNCTLAVNTADSAGGAIHSNVSATLSNCILWGDSPGEIYVEAGVVFVTYCDVQGGWPGVGNLNADPLFANPAGPDGNPATWQDNDYRLAAESPCVDAGDPNLVTCPEATDRDGNPRVWDGDDNGSAVVDMGAYEFGSSAVGDLNCDGMIGFADINPFVLALSNPEAYEAAYPDCNIENADCNGDGVVGLGDINPFVVLLSR